MSGSKQTLRRYFHDHVKNRHVRCVTANLSGPCKRGRMWSLALARIDDKNEIMARFFGAQDGPVLAEY